MAKSQLLNFSQTLNTVQTTFDISSPISVISVATTAVGTGLTPGSRTFTANVSTITAASVITNATWTATVGGASNTVISIPVVTNVGSFYLNVPPTPNSANVDSGTSSATFTFVTGLLNTLYTAAGNDAVVKAINVSSTDSVARTLSIWINTGTGGDKLVGAVSVPAGSGNTGALASIDLLGGTLLPSLPYDANGKRVLPLKAGTIVKVSVPTVTASTNIFVQAMVEEY